jgi:flagellar assembly factor FliW
MNKIVTRFGEIEYQAENLLHFPKGLIGFEQLHDFIVMPNEKEGPLFWIQSVEDPTIAFILTDPTHFFLDYRIAPDQRERQKLQLGEDDECFALAVVTVSPERQISLNLAAPILFAPEARCALQVILDGTHYQSRTALPTIEEVRQVNEQKTQK